MKKMKKIFLLVLLLSTINSLSVPSFTCPTVDILGTRITLVWMGYEPVQVYCGNGNYAVYCVPEPCGDLCNESPCP